MGQLVQKHMVPKGEYYSPLIPKSIIYVFCTFWLTNDDCLFVFVFG